MTETQDCLSRARELGQEYGHIAGTWVFDGNTTHDTHRRFAQWINDGDPQLDHYLPSPFSEGFQPSDLYAELDIAETDARAGEAHHAYVEAFMHAAEAEIERAALYQLETGPARDAPATAQHRREPRQAAGGDAARTAAAALPGTPHHRLASSASTTSTPPPPSLSSSTPTGPTTALPPASRQQRTPTHNDPQR